MKSNFTSHYFLKHFLFFCTFCILSTTIYAQTEISDLDALEDAVNTAKAGDIFIIKNGKYTDKSINLKEVKGTENNRIIIKAESIGGVEFSEDAKFILRTSEYLTIEGITFTNEGTAIKLEGSNNIRITRNTFRLTENSSTKWVYIGGVWDQPNSSFSHHNRIDHNLFENKTLAGNYITIDGSGETQQSQFDLIDHNYFRYNTPRADNEKEAIRIGWSEMSESSGFTLVEFNLFEECNGDPEIISVKSCDNTIRHNTFRKSQGTLSLRHGNRTRVEGNYFLGDGAECEGDYCSGGIRIYGEDHLIINNYFEGLKGYKWDAPITLTEGDAEAGSSSLSKHFRIERAIIAYNTLVNNDHGIEIGYDNGGKYSKPPRDVLMAYNLVQGNQNDLIYYYNEPDNMQWVHNLMYAEENAQLTNDERTFTTDQIVIENPNLQYDEEQKIWFSTSSTPTVTHDPTLFDAILSDIEGQDRPATSNIGADHYYSDLTSVRYKALTSADVGPHSYHPDYDGETPQDHLLISPSTFEVPTLGQTLNAEITTNLDWNLSLNVDWISVDKTSGSGNTPLTIIVAENTSTTIRTAEISVTAGTLERKIQLTQEKAELNLGGEKLEVIALEASDEQSEKGNVKENVIDGDLETRWSAEGEQYIILTLDGQHTVSYIKIVFMNGDERTTTYQVDVSTDNANYINVIPKQESSGTEAGFETIDFEDTPAKYIKLTGYGNSSSAWNSINEVEIWGEKQNSTNPPEEPEAPLSSESQKSHWFIAPNPTSHHYIDLGGIPKEEYIQYEFISPLGHCLLKGETKERRIELPEVSSNTILFIRITDTKENTQLFRIIKK